MFGKTLEVVEYNLTFGTNKRIVNVFSCFRYKKNNNLYVIYADKEQNYEIIHYGSSHIKANTILSMSSRQDETEIIKEFIYKITNNEELSDFEIIDLTNTTGIEIISSNNLPIKLEVLKKLEELTIPVINNIEQNSPKEEKTKVKKHNKINKKSLLFLLIIITIIGGGYIYLTTSLSNDVSKKIICTKQDAHKELNATLNEENIYNFYNNNELSSIDVTNIYVFNNELDYQDFTNRGTYYKYMPNNNAIPNWNNETYTFKVTYNEAVDPSYNKPKNYEEVINYYTKNGYSCNEKIEKK